MSELLAIKLKSLCSIDYLEKEFFIKDSPSYKLNEELLTYRFTEKSDYSHLVELMKKVFPDKYKDYLDVSKDIFVSDTLYTGGLKVFANLTYCSNSINLVDTVYHKPHQIYLTYRPRADYKFDNTDTKRSDLVYSYYCPLLQKKELNRPSVIHAICCYGGTNPLKLLRLLFSIGETDYIIIVIDNPKYKKPFEYVEEIEDGKYFGIPVITSDCKFDIMLENNMLVRENKSCSFYKSFNEKYDKYKTEDGLIIIRDKTKTFKRCDFVLSSDNLLNFIQKNTDPKTTSILISYDHNAVSFSRTLCFNFAYNKFKKNYILMFNDDDDFRFPSKLFNDDESKEIISNEMLINYYTECNKEFCSNLIDIEKYKIPFNKYLNSDIPHMGLTYTGTFMCRHIAGEIFSYKHIYKRCYTYDYSKTCGEDERFLDLHGGEFKSDDIYLYGHLSESHSVPYYDPNERNPLIHISHIVQRANYYLKTGELINFKLDKKYIFPVVVNLIDNGQMCDYTVWNINGVMFKLD